MIELTRVREWSRAFRSENALLCLTIRRAILRRFFVAVDAKRRDRGPCSSRRFPSAERGSPRCAQSRNGLDETKTFRVAVSYERKANRPRVVPQQCNCATRYGATRAAPERKAWPLAGWSSRRDLLWQRSAGLTIRGNQECDDSLRPAPYLLRLHHAARVVGCPSPPIGVQPSR
jgi:hypothetical protein